MGLGEGILVLLGVLPIERPDFKKKVGEETFMDEGRLYNKIEKLEELNGQRVWVSDIHNGIIAGNLNYIPLFQDKYFLRESSKTGNTVELHVHDLKYIW